MDIKPEEIIEWGKAVIRVESEAVKTLFENINNEFVKAANIIFKCKGRVVLTGMGKSGLIARKIVATMNSTGTPAFYLHPTDAMHGDLGMVREEDVVILISKSGVTEEVVNLVPMLKRLKVKLIAMAAFPKSKLASECDVFLNIGDSEEACPHDLAPTSSTTASLVMGDALSIALLKMKGFTAQDFALLHPGGSLGKRLSLKITEIMQKGEKIPIVHEDTSLKDSILEITSKRLGTTCVVNNENVLVGVITDGDLRRQLEKNLDIHDLCAKDIMTKNPKVLSENVLASLALQQMENFKITSLIIVDGIKRPVGIVHLHDLINLGLTQR